MSKQKTYLANKNTASRKWRVINAEGKILGRLASEIANALRGKDKAEFTPNVDCGDFVVVLNCEKIKVSGKKEEQKLYRHHTGYQGGLKTEKLAHLRQRKPEDIIRKAVKGMLPHNRLSEQLITKLKIVKGSENPYTAQCKEAVVVD